MSIKATRLHPGVPLQVYMVGMVVAEVVVEGMVEVESVVVVLKVAVVDMSVVVVVDMAESDVAVSVGMVVKAIVAAITELAI
jgi:hypothetical protein